MDDKIHTLFNYCRRGQTDNLKQLVEEHEVEINVRDKWDSTPLYYACLCGHEETVEYLLKMGARCEANTFDGERCLYSALTQKIKEMLKGFKAITKDCMRRDGYLEFFRIALINQDHKDVCFIVHGAHIFAHRVILSARSQYFAHMLKTKWMEKRYIHIKHPLVTESAFRLMMQYFYTDRIDIPMDDVPDLKRLCRQCRLADLQEKLEQAARKFHLYTDTKPKCLRENVSILSIQPELNSLTLMDSYMQLVEYCIPYSMRMKQFPDCLPDIFFMELPELEDDSVSVYGDYMCKDQIPLYADICFIIDNNYFYGHKVFFCGRSEYFKSLENFYSISATPINLDDGITRVPLNEISAEVFTVIITFIYSGHADIPTDILEEVLHFAALYILPNLKRLCSNKLVKSLTVDAVLNSFKLSRLYDLSSLEAACCNFMAQHLDEIIHMEEFSALILADSQEIKNRQQTDTIPLVDDIRFHLCKAELPGFFMLQDEEKGYFGSPDNKFRMLENLLDHLGLEA